MRHAIVFGFICMSLFSFSAISAESKILNLTGLWPELSDIDFADPSRPDFSNKDIVRIHLTAGEVLEWKTSEFPHGRPTHHRMKLYHASGKILNESAGEDAWDLNIVNWSPDLTVAYAGVMKAPSGTSHASWPDDNWSRRVYAFTQKNNKWMCAKDPLLDEVPASPTWLDHGYGHDFLTDDDGTTYVFYEKVSEERDGHPWRTDLFARRMLNPFEADGQVVTILNTNRKSWPALKRSFGGKLAEGPRPFKVGPHYFVSFSGGDYNSENYGIHLMVSKKPLGPYAPYLNEQGNNLKDFSLDLEKHQRLTWGAGRAVFFEWKNTWWILFHGIPSEDGEAPEDGKRNLFMAPVTFDDLESAKPTVRF